jgi:hypothetical protein
VNGSDPQDSTLGDQTTHRRQLLVSMGKCMIFLMVNGASGLLSPAEARDQKIPLHHLTAEEGAILEALANTLLPGAAEAGITYYIDDQLRREVPLLFLKYTDYSGPYDQFYKLGLRSLDRESISRFRKSFRDATPEQQIALVRSITQTSPAGWTGPPATLFYFVLRNDAVDVFYGTPQGFDKLGIPYLALIRPPADW